MKGKNLGTGWEWDFMIPLEGRAVITARLTSDGPHLEQLDHLPSRFMPCIANSRRIVGPRCQIVFIELFPKERMPDDMWSAFLEWCDEFVMVMEDRLRGDVPEFGDLLFGVPVDVIPDLITTANERKALALRQ